MRMYLQVQRYLTRAFFWSEPHLYLPEPVPHRPPPCEISCVETRATEAALERIRRVRDIQGQILALAF